MNIARRHAASRPLTPVLAHAPDGTRPRPRYEPRARQAAAARSAALRVTCPSWPRTGPSAPVMPASSSPRPRLRSGCLSMLESLLPLTIEDTDGGDCIGRFSECVSRTRHGSEFEKSPKAFVQTYIATTQHPSVAVGVAVQKHTWQWDHPALSSIREFVQTLSRVADRGSIPGG